MAKKYIITLTEEESSILEVLLNTKKSTAPEVKRAYILLSADENGDKKWKDSRISETYLSSISTIERLRKTFIEEGFQIAIKGKKREVFKEKILDGEVEAHLIALRCSNPPTGYNKWTLQLLADKMIELNYVEQISHESVRQLLKKTN